MPIYQHIFTGAAANHPYQFGMHTAISSGNIDDAHAAAAAWLTDLVDGAGPGLTGVTWLTRTTDIPTRLKTYDIDELNGRKTNVTESSVSVAGSSSNPQMPIGTCLCLTLRGGQIGRKERGRIYLWPFVTSAMDSGSVASSAFGFIVDGVRHAYTNLFASGYVPVIYHAATVGFSSVTRVDFSNVWAFVDSRRAAVPITRTDAYP